MDLPIEFPPITAEQKSEFCLIVSIGCDRETACKLLNCSPAQLQGELQQDAEFSAKLLRAEATAELNHMRNLHNAAKDEKNWRVSVWWLERCAADRYARRAPESVSAKELSSIVDELAEVIALEFTDQDDRWRLLNRLAQIARSVSYDMDVRSGEEQPMKGWPDQSEKDAEGK